MGVPQGTYPPQPGPMGEGVEEGVPQGTYLPTKVPSPSSQVWQGYLPPPPAQVPTPYQVWRGYPKVPNPPSLGTYPLPQGQDTIWSTWYTTVDKSLAVDSIYVSHSK